VSSDYREGLSKSYYTLINTDAYSKYLIHK
jgi:hypothetical protein